MLEKIVKTKKWLEDLISSPGQELNRWVRILKFQIQLSRFSLKRLHDLNAMAMSASLSFRTIFAMIPLLVLSLLIMSALGKVEVGKKSLRQFLDNAGIGQITVTSGINNDHNKPDSTLPVPPVKDTTPYQTDTKNTYSTTAKPNIKTDNTKTNNDATTTPNPSDLASKPDSTTKDDRQYNVADEIEKLVDSVQSKLTASAVGVIGVIVMIYTALTMLTDIEKSLNRIFEARRHRSFGKRLMLYWSVVTLLPIVATGASILGQKTQAFIMSSKAIGVIIGSMGFISPIIGGIIMVALVYRLMPNTRTKFRWALFGATLVVPVWFLLKYLFGFYVHKCVGTNNIYGNLGLIPLFLLWINISWTMFLYGAVIAYTSANLSVMESSEMAAGINLGPLDALAATMAIAGPFSRGKGPVSFKQLRENLNLPDECIQTLIERLIERNVICPVEDELSPYTSWLPARPLESIQLLDVTGLNPDKTIIFKELKDQYLKQELQQICDITQKNLANLTLADATKIIPPGPDNRESQTD